MAGFASDNKDLLWDIATLRGKQKAVDFFKEVCGAFCVYSPSVSQLYTSYEVFWRPGSDGLAVLPNPYAFHDTFSFIPESVITTTGIRVIPGDAVGRHEQVMISIPIKGGKMSPPVPVERALELIRTKYQQHGRQFLPVITRGDLREFRKNSPYLHLHVMNEKLLTQMSSLDRYNVQGVICERLHRLDRMVA
ncbi:hypothetical protein [Parendozoicomonas haliclonae]|uniref:Uncharacterized protein n=1 Tax=Parendozoicomonas haliclonae TaxID=1960125 RepID=A0A1X7ANX8_9GAMM|nr:hypothetical protein [Parendozoicomonas haliclonae]SMA49789.1 hypothetical protein EHSB41UT_03578 [Parendozoicomonas haliclonae]